LKKRVENLYNQSWIKSYFNYSVASDTSNNEEPGFGQNLIMYKLLNDKGNLRTIKDNRFTIYIHIPDKSKKYFLPEVEWKSGYDNLHQLERIAIEELSLIRNAFNTQPYPYSSSPSYVEPFFLTFRSDKSVQSNYFSFNSFYKNNTDLCILAMLQFNPDHDSFETKFSTGIVLPYTSSKILNNILEFVLVDSKKQLIEIENQSQLFISITLTRKIKN